MAALLLGTSLSLHLFQLLLLLSSPLFTCSLEKHAGSRESTGDLTSPPVMCMVEQGACIARLVLLLDDIKGARCMVEALQARGNGSQGGFSRHPWHHSLARRISGQLCAKCIPRTWGSSQLGGCRCVPLGGCRGKAMHGAGPCFHLPNPSSVPPACIMIRTKGHETKGDPPPWITKPLDCLLTFGPHCLKNHSKDIRVLSRRCPPMLLTFSDAAPSNRSSLQLLVVSRSDRCFSGGEQRTRDNNSGDFNVDGHCAALGIVMVNSDGSDPGGGDPRGMFYCADDHGVHGSPSQRNITGDCPILAFLPKENNTSLVAQVIRRCQRRHPRPWRHKLPDCYVLEYYTHHPQPSVPSVISISGALYACSGLSEGARCGGGPAGDQSCGLPWLSSFQDCWRQQPGDNTWREDISAPADQTAPRVDAAVLTQPELSPKEPCSVYFPFNTTKGCLKTTFPLSGMGKLTNIDLFAQQQLSGSKEMQPNPFHLPHISHTHDVKQGISGRRRERASLPLIRTRRAANRPPLFLQHNYQVQVAENQPPGTPVITMTAQDPDTGESGRVMYIMDALMNSKSLELFSIDSVTGLISTTEILDRENMEQHYFRVTAIDHGSSRLSATTMVSVTVADKNDHSPSFEQTEYRESIRENVEEGYPILQLRATDIDSQANANIKYRFVNEQAAHSVFEIDARSGLITTSGQVDREKREKYSLIVEASDQGKDPGPRSSTVKVEITVFDENDNVPQFSEKRYIVQIREDIKPHTEILRVMATDLDKDNNAVVHYNLISGNSRGQFSIDSFNGAIQVISPLDFESEREYTLRVRAQDSGRPPLSNNTGMISVQVLDINDHAPIFVSTPFQVNVLENVPLGHSVIHIQAVDADYGENARMEYKLLGVSSTTPFVINSATGWITVSGQLDRETEERYLFGVEARDHGNPPLSASASVTITILDVNDNRPEFTQREYFIRLNEDASVGTSVLSVTAIDRDVNSIISYQITGGNTRNRFAISTQGGAGLITLSLPLDYKQERRYILTVTASDRILHDNCYVHINITDANTHRPVFQSAHYTIDINEDRPIGSTVVIISAADDDVGENARITYFLEDNIPQFLINPDSGAITLNALLDYEDQMIYSLAVVAKDNGIPQKSDTTYVEIMVNDVNDNAPQFLNTQYHGIVSEDAPPFTSVLQISATDRDSHTNGRVQYTFQNGEDGDGDFTIEPTSGIIRTVRKLDRETVPFYELTAYAVDRGIPPQRSPVRIQVAVQDVNDNAPVFPADEFEVFVKENSIVGSVVGRIKALDPDEGPNAQIMYQIVEGNIPEIFQMDFFSGELTALIDLDYETRPEYVIVVQATSAPLVSRATVHIKLIDQNDNTPVLKNFQILFNNYISNSSNTFPSGVIGKIPAYDPDVSDKLFYTFERGNELNLLIVNHSSGELRLSRKLDNNRPLMASMLVTVSDGIHSVTAQCVLRVLIITEDMLSNSITVRLENMSQERFLSPLLTSFLEGVSTVLATPKEDIFIFNIQNDTDVKSTILNISFSALVPQGDRSQFFSSEDLQEQLYMKRMTLTSASMLEVLPFDDNVCLREPCENYMKCISVLKFDSSAPFIASESILFRPIHPITGLRCRCPQGFTGDYCEIEINLCYSNPCQNGGVCARREGGYTCICQERFTGQCYCGCGMGWHAWWFVGIAWCP
ncbi:cadherin EGF LAG seven-pass G-type receptor 3-like [Bufo gargarizans]|uniref:cadherin EGF LAG seven-pass G-type receptor 3-like n=1 Tax=Bufo gargarizans TaxID=30331 RepID=UPI001CF23A70|nr:cadherin EGF LAG seven-pass G-type receptor 3-like [Bufo gargarizans]